MLLEKLESAFANSVEIFVFTCWLPNGLWVITQHSFHGAVIPMSNPIGFSGALFGGAEAYITTAV